MFTTFKSLVMTAIAMSLIFIQPAYAGFDSGLAAYKKGDYQTAIKELKPLAERGDSQAQLKLGLIYHAGNGVKQDYTMACSWYLKAAEQGHVLAQSILGMMYSHGKGVEQNFKKSLFWYTKSANQGHAFSQASLGEFYNQGIGVLQDHYQASEWYLKAAEQGHVGAQAILAIMYAEGRGVEQNYIAAHMWSNIALANTTSDFVKDWLIDEDLLVLLNQAPKTKEAIKKQHNDMSNLLKKLRDLISKLITPEELDTAQVLAKQWMLKRRI